MKVTCPSCGHASQIDAAKIPEKGVQTKCRKCSTRFLLTRTGPPAASSSPDTEAYICEKCRHKQHPSRACVYCGNPFPQFQAPADKPPAGEQREEKRDKPAAATAPERTAPERISPKPALYPISTGEGLEGGPNTIPCPYCDEPIREKAKKCKHCGEFLDRKERAAAGGPVKITDVFTGLVDFRFARMITPELVKAIYIITLVLGGLGAVTLIFFAVRRGAYGAAAGTLFGYLLALLFSRVYSELSIIAFKIEENTRRGRR